MRQLDTLRQTSTVSDYHTKFEQLAHNIMLYNPNYDDTFFVVRFLGGLKDEIRALIALHRRKDVDTANALALMQEEEIESERRSTYPRADHKESGKPSSKGFSAGDKFKNVYKKDDTRKPDKQLVDDKLAALFAFRKANGLCFTCEKWTGRTHKCPDQVPLHVLQEVLEVFQIDADSETGDSDTKPESVEECIMSMQPQHVSSSQSVKRKTIRFKGMVGKRELLILLDYGSVGKFINEEVAQHFQSQLQPCEQLQFSTADGTPLTSDKYIPGFQWFIQGHSFTFDARVLPLSALT
jgi:hypothetical protein